MLRASIPEIDVDFETMASYQAPNGDTWLLLHHGEFGRRIVLHRPSGASENEAIKYEFAVFETRFRDTPQYLELRRQVQSRAENAHHEGITG
jgi:hypothetical protein